MTQMVTPQFDLCEGYLNKAKNEVEVATTSIDVTVYGNAQELEKNLSVLLSAQTSRLKALRLVNELVSNGGRVFFRHGNATAALNDAFAGVQLSEKLDSDQKRKAENYLLKLPRSSVVDIDNARAYVADTVDASGTSVARQSAPAGGRLPDLWSELTDSISGKNKGLENYEASLDKYNYLYKQVTNILSQLGSWVTADGDNYMKVHFKKIGQELQSLLNKYNPPGKDQIIAGASPIGGFKTEADARLICEELGLDPELCIYQNKIGDQSYCVIPDLSQIRSMLNNLPGEGKTDDYKISIAAYNAWKSGFDSQMSRLEDALQVRGQKYTNTHSRFENYHKTISSIIQSMADMLKSFLNF